MNQVEKIAQVAYEAGVNKALNELGLEKEAGLMDAIRLGMARMNRAARPTSFGEGLGAGMEAGRQLGAVSGTALGAGTGAALGRELGGANTPLALALAGLGGVTGGAAGNIIGRPAGMLMGAPSGAVLGLPGLRQARNFLTRPIV